MKLLFITLLLLTSTLQAKQAPDFSLKAHDGKTYTLSKLKGKIVILEWYNSGCPYVRKHYDAKLMQNLQKKYKDKVVWLVINSSNVGKQGHIKDTAAAANEFKKEGMHAKALLIDTPGKVGKLYEAKTTPHMYIINKAGKLVYRGAIDNNSSYYETKATKNYVDIVMAKLLKKDDISLTHTKPYGCSVKY